jgi:hypothetical protein
MSLPKHDPQTARANMPPPVEALFEPNDEYRLFREKILPKRENVRPTLIEMYSPGVGRGAIEPVVMAGVTLLQFMYNQPDAQAAQMVRFHMGWKYALGLELGEKGFHPTSLVKFRQRVLDCEEGRVVFDAILAGLRADGLIHAPRRQRLDSTHVLGCVSKMSRLQVVRETLGMTLGMIEDAGKATELTDWDVLIERYCDETIHWTRQSQAQLSARFDQAGHDALRLIKYLRQQPASLRGHDQSLLLERVFLEQFELVAAGPVRRQREPSGGVKNPHDPQAQWAAKDQDKKKQWVGYKAQVIETVDENARTKDKGEPTEQFVTELTTTEAITSDFEGMERALDAQQARGLKTPQELFVDSGYVSGKTLAEARDEGRELVGPARPSPKRNGTFSAEEFDVSVTERKAVCPAGKTSRQCSRIHDSHQKTTYDRFEWGSQCDDCRLQSECTRSKDGRRIVSVGEHHDLVRRRREEMKTEGFQKRMRQRNGIEGTISELVRLGMRRSRYRGLAKTTLANYMFAAACNTRRYLRLLAWQRNTANSN